MPTVPLHPPSSTRHTLSPAPPASFPSLLHTPLGLALLELQGTINAPTADPGQDLTRVGKLVFPNYNPETDADREGAWMKKVWLYVGHQRMLGDVRKLPKPLGLMGRKDLLGRSDGDDAMDVDGDGEGAEEGGGEAKKRGDVEELQILEIVRYKLVFSARPEPFGEDDGD